MQFSSVSLIEEYRLPASDPIRLKKRLAEIAKTFRRLHGTPARNPVIEAKVTFIEQWIAKIPDPEPRPMPTRGAKKPHKVPFSIPVNNPKKRMV